MVGQVALRPPGPPRVGARARARARVRVWVSVKAVMVVVGKAARV